MRFDLASPTRRPDAARIVLEMAVWADDAGVGAIALSEHHPSTTCFLRSPLVLATAIAARTTVIRVNVAIAILPLYDPVRLANDLAMAHEISGGRVTCGFGVGYLADEYERFGAPFDRRFAEADRSLISLRHEFERLGTEGPPLALGGSSLAAARRAARHGLMFWPQVADEVVADEYRSACASVGSEPRLIPPPEGPQVVFVASDPEPAWDALGPHLLFDATQYAKWHESAGARSATHSAATTVAELREEGIYTIVTPDECRRRLASDGRVTLHPLCGGVDALTAWRHLHAFGRCRELNTTDTEHGTASVTNSNSTTNSKGHLS